MKKLGANYISQYVLEFIKEFGTDNINLNQVFLFFIFSKFMDFPCNQSKRERWQYCDEISIYISHLSPSMKYIHLKEPLLCRSICEYLCLCVSIYY